MSMSNIKPINAYTVMPIVFKYQKIDTGEILEAIGYLNYSRDEVYFPDNPELTNEESRRFILSQQDSKIEITPNSIPQDLLVMVEKIRSGNYKGVNNGG